MRDQTEIIVEKREEVMLSSARNASPTLRTAHFLNPTRASIKALVPKNPSLCPSTLPPTFDPENWPIDATFYGWQEPTANWKSWVRHMEGMYEPVWKRAGIHSAILSSTYRVQRDYDWIIGLAEKWCPETNTFIFPWAEATVTLEDVVILGGYSVLGSPFFSCSREIREDKEIEDKLKEARNEVGRGLTRGVCQIGWMEEFMFSGSEIEHEAFLSLWLEMFVFHDSENTLRDCIFPIAIHLAKGEVVALAPAVLASIYRDLGLLKATIVAVTEFRRRDYADILAVALWSPLHLVQLWAWERFPAFQPQASSIRNGEPRSALWDKVKSRKVENVRFVLDSATETFCWRPYATGRYGLEFYKEKEEWRELGSNQDLLSFALCLRVSELVGIGCIEQYLPHRVARQFGFDQDIPCDIAKSNGIPELAWINYIRPFSVTKLFVPSPFFVPDVTIKYLRWWKQSELDSHDLLKNAIIAAVRRKRSSRKRSEGLPKAWIGKKGDNNVGIFPSPSNAKANNGALSEVKSLQKPVECIMNLNTEIGRPVRALENQAGIPRCHTPSKSRVGGENSAFEVPGLALESRIAILEKAMAELKAARFGSRFEKNCS